VVAALNNLFYVIPPNEDLVNTPFCALSVDLFSSIIITGEFDFYFLNLKSFFLFKQTLVLVVQPSIPVNSINFTIVIII
jgi:hypothetical protein